MDDLNVTPVYELHLELGAKMVPFAGYSMPVQYPMGVMAEHQHCRSSAGLFDVSHMGQVWIDGPDWETVALGFERLVPQDVLGLDSGRQRYGFFTNDTGGIEDDLMFARQGDRLIVVVNAACKEADINHMKAALEPELTVSIPDERALIALQGPKAETALARLGDGASQMRFMDLAALNIAGQDCLVTRSGYTGEDGFEISVPADGAEALCRAILEQDEVAPIGLGARDSLRLEAGLCLYGNDIDADTTPVEAGLTWAIQKVRRNGGERAGEFPGSETILDQTEKGPSRRRVGLLPDGRAPMRSGVEIFESETAATAIGKVTSGGFGPSIGGPVAMGYVSSLNVQQGTRLWGEVRGKRLPVVVAPLPFVPANFKR